MSHRTKIIAVATQKGGAGKSTISIHLAVQAMQLKKDAQVILLDLDPQALSPIGRSCASLRTRLSCRPCPAVSPPTSPRSRRMAPTTW
ncbi:ParA family protein [Citreimonas salinaria]|uniref:ParA family protein n=1 Tax=Citreimonas salinaria TaxID=321339 RepID=UPI000B7D66E2